MKFLNGPTTDKKPCLGGTLDKTEMSYKKLTAEKIDFTLISI